MFARRRLRPLTHFSSTCLRAPSPRSPGRVLTTRSWSCCSPRSACALVTVPFPSFDAFGRGVVAAGGSVLAALLPPPPRAAAAAPDDDDEPDLCNGFGHADIDLYLIGLDEDEAVAVLRRIHAALQPTVAAITRSATAITFAREGGRIGGRHVQVILHRFASVGELLTGFDLDSCCVAFDGVRVLALPRAVRALRRGYNLIGIDASRYSAATESRALKYVLRGFSIAVPLAKRWRELLSPAVTSAPRRGGAAFSGFAKLVAWEAALQGDVSGCTETSPFYDYDDAEIDPSTDLSLPPGESRDLVYTLHMGLCAMHKRATAAAAAAATSHPPSAPGGACAVAMPPARLAFVPTRPIDAATSETALDDLLDLTVHGERALRWAGPLVGAFGWRGRIGISQCPAEGWGERYATSVPIVARFAPPKDTRWPYNGAPPPGNEEAAAWFEPAWLRPAAEPEE